ncbi:HNH endonuclease signature motif containing protein [Hydrogenophaga sp.]|uniref:HNH endonuclease n=1 Tax=Hydrogenophaga sp. TaxID=1904254 RepID=UPI0026161FC1|nr:HNH endonuclease signature motif containing protein [Hydrogenophaga sp.]
MAKPISKFFESLGLPFRNIRWSWGARHDDVLLLRTWDDEYQGRQKTVTVLREPARYQQSESYGLDERIMHLQALWKGELAGYTVIATVKDRVSHPREIKEYRDDVVFSIKRIAVTEEGAIIVELGEAVPIASLKQHALTHRTAAGDGLFPVEESARSGLSTDSYQQKIPAIRAWLIEVCQAEGTVTYSDVMNRFGLSFYPLRNAMSRLGHDCRNAGEPIITALIVDKETGRCSQGLFDEFHIDDDILERQRCYAYWAGQALEPTPEPPPSAPSSPPNEQDLEQRAARFAQVEIRPQQRAFREAVFRAFDGRCVVSGCDVPEALEAAHLLGRDWRQGHNEATDGILLRRDLHTLYDRELLRITEAGVVELDARIVDWYAGFSGVQALTPFKK